MSVSRKFLGTLRSFAGNRRGNVAMIYGLSILPLAIASGAGLDYARAMIVRTRLAEALDAAGLAVGGSPAMSQADMQALAQSYFNANYNRDASYGTPSPVAVVQSGQDFALTTSISMPTILMHIVGIDALPVSYSVTITRNSKNLEVALALDTTGSMSGSRISDLKTAASDLIDLVVQDAQSPTYSKLALIPYSMAVNVGSYADQVRGTITGATPITNATWFSGTAKTITGATKANPVVITAANHGFANGDRVVIKNVGGMTQLNYTSTNNNYYIVAGAATNTFKLRDKNGTDLNGGSFNSYSSNTGTVTKCQVSTCEVQVTSNAHGLANGDLVYITGVSGMTQINNALSNPEKICSATVGQPCGVWQVASATSGSFVLPGSNPTYSAYTSGGSSYCTKLGCQYYRFTNASNGTNMWQPSTCVSERTTDAYTDAAPSTTLFGYNYAASGNPCLSATLIPLSSDKASLKTAVSNLGAAGSTAGHIGIAWAWYTLAQNFGYLWPGNTAAAAYDADNTMKFAVLMTDGAFNTPYCSGVISKDAASGSGNTSDHISCNAPNGSSATQALALCNAMKSKGITVYTVGFDIANDTAAINLLTSCASDSSHAYFPTTGAGLKSDFHDIAQQITNLRLKS